MYDVVGFCFHNNINVLCTDIIIFEYDIIKVAMLFETVNGL